MILFFFFQAEDGIRCHCVTGVQTCALPIYPACDPMTTIDPPPPARRGGAMARRQRSEERRVGKECRSRWWRDSQDRNKSKVISTKTDKLGMIQQVRTQHEYVTAK